MAKSIHGNNLRDAKWIIDINGPNGNVFPILGMVKNIQRQLKRNKLPTEQYDELLKNFTKMEYSEIIRAVEDITGGLIMFVDGHKNSGQTYL